MNRSIRSLCAPLLLCLCFFLLHAAHCNAQTFRGTILGTAIGVVTIQLLKNGLQLAGLRGESTVILIGTVLILSILLNQFLERHLLTERAFAKSTANADR